MSIKKTVAICAAIGCLQSLAVRAQTTNQVATNENLFRVTFRATCRSLNSNQTHLVNTIINNAQIIAHSLGSNILGTATGTSTVETNLLHRFALVYNTTADGLQVVNATNGDLIADVLSFGGGSSVAGPRERVRFAFAFVPNETNAVGSALLDEIGTRSVAGSRSATANITGNLYFALTGNTELGGTNSPATNNPAIGTNALSSTSPTNNLRGLSPTATTATNFFMTKAFDDPTARICTGFFFTTGRLMNNGRPVVGTAD